MDGGIKDRESIGDRCGSVSLLEEYFLLFCCMVVRLILNVFYEKML